MGEPKCLFFVLLIWCLGSVHAQDSQQSCPKPELKQGYFGSDEETYQHGTELYYACEKGWKPAVEGWWAMVKCENRKWSHTPQCIGDEASPNVRPSARPQPGGPFLPVDRCGEKPTVDNGDFISDSDRNRMALTFTCINYYKLVGSEQVMCHNDQTWSELPICKAPCTLDKNKRTFDMLDLTKDMFVKEGESQTFLCKKNDNWKSPSAADVRCQNGQVTIGRCALGCILDTWNHHWLDLTQDMFVKEGRQTWNCNQKDYTGRHLVADVKCQSGYLTVGGCKSNATVG
ncbi:complement factor H-related protein 2-like isoform X2 [Oncorhynchus tshawytscha]|uniref:Sushi domain-containing protein n=1 Tax=Oncorhynchus tshawytscha TaxID=74940 RepID=A0AAZ3PH59_ONCTS|nr:complement factor H-related protein 2-like isoform X2 [Oncorhynchus tshawytscha]